MKILNPRMTISSENGSFVRGGMIFFMRSSENDLFRSPDRVARGLPTGGQGSKVYVLCAEPKEHKHFRPGTRPGGSGTRPGGSVTGVTEELLMCQMFMCLFRPQILHFKARGLGLLARNCSGMPRIP